MASSICMLFVLSAGIAFAEPEESPDGPQHVVVYLTLDEALGISFRNADSLWSVEWAPTEQERRRIEHRLGWGLADDSVFTIYRAIEKNRDLGYALVGNEVGLYEPITFMVRIGTDRKVSAVHVMVFRESRGGEVRRRRFLSQYSGKSIDSPIRINRDIIGVTGATLSVRALNAGVKKALAIVETAFPLERGE